MANANKNPLSRVSTLWLRGLQCLTLTTLVSCSVNNHKGTDTTQSASLPSVVISAEGRYWQPGHATTSTQAATVVVDTEHRFQTWHGLGGTFNEAGWDALQELTEDQRQAVMRSLFDETEGTGFIWGRIPMGASDYALTRYSLNEVADDLDMTHFSIERDHRYLIPYIKAAQAIRPDLKFWGSPWSPPPWMKTNKIFDRGAFDPKYYGAYADYFVEWVKAYENQNIPIDHVQPQNEPGWAQGYPSCAWGPSIADGEFTDRPVTLGTFVEHHLIPKIKDAQLGTDIWYGTLSNDQTYDAYWNAVSDNALADITGVGLQWGTHSRVAELARTAGKDGKPLLVMQTEHRCGNYPWLADKATSQEDADRTNFLATIAPNNHAYAEESWDLIKNWLESGVHIYSAWNMVLDTGGFNMDTDRPWPQNTLITVDRQARTYRLTPAYYVFRHIGQYVKPGATRIAVEGGDALAFQNPDGRVVTVLYNDQTEAKDVTLSVAGKKAQLALPARGWATVHW